MPRMPDRRRGLAIRVVPGGCSGFSYSMQIEDGPRPEDEVLNSEGLKVFVDPVFSSVS
jgi:iron-sulfur cluster assembly protein